MKAWWNGLSPQERRTVSVGGGVLAVILFYFLFWQPLHEENAQLARDLEEQRALLAWAGPTVAEIRLRGGGSGGDLENGGNGGQALFALADQNARQAGLGPVLRRVEPSGQRGARVVFEQVGFDELVRWLGELQDRYGVEVSSLSLQRAEIEGRVDAQLVLETPGS